MGQRPSDIPPSLFRLGQLVLLLLFLLALAGGITLVVRQAAPRGIEVTVPTATPPPQLKVYLSGAVAQPGVYPFRPGERLTDALRTAGGAAPDADLERVNLALRLQDEGQYHIPRMGERTEPGRGALPGGGSPGAAPSERININTASAQQLQALPGIGEAKAQAIVSYRQQHGLFSRVEDLLKVSGIGPATLDRVRPLIRVE